MFSPKLMLCPIVLSISFITADVCHSNEQVGDFDGQSDVGNPKNSGAATYDPVDQRYRLSGSGVNMWFDKDQFHFAWKKMTGDFILTARASLEGAGVDPHRKLGWMVRSSLETNSPHVNVAVHGDGLTSMQFRRELGSETEELKSDLTGADVIQLERSGNRYTMSVARFGQPFVISHLDGVELGDEIYIGLFVCSHNPDVVESAVFDNVRITVPAPENFRPYRDYIGSRLEVMDVNTGDRHIVFSTTEGVEAPNWTPDGSALIYNSKGQLYRISLEKPEPILIETDFAKRNNNDHVLSPDGSRIGISHHAEEENGASVVYTVPIEGGVPRRVTKFAPSYLHGWSPDGGSLIYTGQRDGEFDIYKIPVDGGDEIRLTTAAGLDDGSEFSPDGQFIYFNSARSGKMEIWRMKADGTEQKQLTDDAMNNWFPHVSPDGKRIVFLSFDDTVKAEDHPFYKRVVLRMMDVDQRAPKVIAYLYGGQGTINVPSWSPDGQRIAFVSYSQSLAATK